MEKNTLLALIISLFAGLATLLGALILIFAKRKNPKLLTFALGFAAGVMLSISLTDFYPNSFNFLTDYFKHAPTSTIMVVGFMVLGFLLASLIDHYVPHQPFDKKRGETPHRNLYHVGFVSMIAIALHNLPEGIATFMSGYVDTHLGLIVGISIAMHNIPEGFTVATPIYYATGNKKKALLYTFIAGMTEPLGALFAYFVLRPFLNSFLLGGVFGIIAGIMVYIAIEELMPTSRQYGYNRLALTATFIGIILPPLLHLF